MNRLGAAQIGLLLGATAGGFGLWRMAAPLAPDSAPLRKEMGGERMDAALTYDAQPAAAKASLGGNLASLRGISRPSERRISPPGAVRKLARNAFLSLSIADEAKARALARAAAFKHGAEIEAENVSGDGAGRFATLTLKVPPEKLDSLLAALEPLGRVVDRSVSTVNMSEEYVDLGSRLKHLRAVETRLNGLLSFKTNKLADVLQVERELERVGVEIERLLGRMKYIDTVAASAVVTVRLQEPAKDVSEAPGVGVDIRNALMKSFNAFVRTGVALLSVTGFLLAIGLWTLPVAAGLWLLKRRYWS